MNFLSSAVDWLLVNADALISGGLMAAILVLVMLGLRWLGHRILAADPLSITWKGVIGKVLARTSFTFMVLVALDTVARYADMPARPEHILHVLVTIAVAFQAAAWARELILGIIHRNVGEEPGGTAIGNAYGVLRVLISVALFGLALIVILDNLGINVTALVAGLGVGGIAIGLAAQGIFSDLFAALAILFDRPFRRGDTIRYDQTTGTVEKIGLKTTRLRSPAGEQVVMANTKLLEREIHNLASAYRRRVVIPFGIAQRTPADRLAEVADIADAAVRTAGGCKMVRCVLVGIGSSSLDHELVFDDDSIDAEKNFARKAAVLRAFLKGLENADLKLATPVTTSFTALPDGQLVPPYSGAEVAEEASRGSGAPIGRAGPRSIP